MNDPREMVVRPESGVTLEQDNRIEEMYHWGAMVVDLCGMPVEEYMKPMTVIGIGGGGGGEIPETMYTLKFVIDGVTVAQESLKSGDPIPFSVDGNKDGRNFLGWFYGSTQYSEGALMPSKSLTLTAKYNCDVKFIFVIDGEEKEVSAYTVNYNSKPSSIPSTIMEGYTFKGWEPSVTEPVKSHTTYVGAFEIKTFTVTWNGYSEGPIVQTYNYGDALVEPEAPTKEGYSFTKWDKSLPEVVKSNYVFTAQFTINQYVITFYQEWNGVKSELSAVTKNYGSTITLPKIPVESGYTYSSWESEYKGTSVPAYNIEYVTIKTANTYILAYYDNGELIKEDEYDYMERIIPFTYEKEGYYVSEWSNLPELMPYNNVSAYCTTEIMKFMVIFEDQNGEQYVNEGVEYGTDISSLIPEIEGKTFNVNDENILNEKVYSDMTIMGNVSVNRYKVYITVNGEKVDIDELPYGTVVDDFINENFPAEEGYHIIIDKNYDTVPSNDSLVVEVSYEANIWVLAYTTNDDINGEISIAFNELILPYLPNTEKEGKDFKGWKMNNGELVTDETRMPNSNLEVYGEYAIQMFTVSITDGENVVHSDIYPYNTSLEEILNKTEIVDFVNEQSANGYTIVFTINDEAVNEDLKVTSDLNISVSRVPNVYVLTFMMGDEVFSSTNVSFGDIITYPTIENKVEDGIEYVFVWEDTSYNGVAMPPQNLTIVGNYQAKAAAPIYYGSFVVPVSAYSEENISQYINESDVDTNYYQSVAVNDCVDVECLLAFVYPAYPPFIGLSKLNLAREKKNYYEPLTVLLPVSVVEKYDISFKDGVLGTQRWGYMKTDGKVITIKGDEYKAFVFAEDGTRADAVEKIYNYKIQLTEK